MCVFPYFVVKFFVTVRQRTQNNKDILSTTLYSLSLFCFLFANFSILVRLYIVACIGEKLYEKVLKVAKNEEKRSILTRLPSLHFLKKKYQSISYNTLLGYWKKIINQPT